MLDKCKKALKILQVLSMENFFLITVCNHKDRSTHEIVIDQDENSPPQDENIPPQEPSSTLVSEEDDSFPRYVSSEEDDSFPRYESFSFGINNGEYS